ncbi:hypothetical protein EYF80_001612 [Liparis tanakae]|uniref:Uncharacterized protein n=1 Tax=Liparis tanakae TaxID=230148 RepID=A0A4Z2JDD7_9TELE|nr:hypothetical protein EYF80_001612 [Liparis tanakae]
MARGVTGTGLDSGEDSMAPLQQHSLPYLNINLNAHLAFLACLQLHNPGKLRFYFDSKVQQGRINHFIQRCIPTDFSCGINCLIQDPSTPPPTERKQSQHNLVLSRERQHVELSHVKVEQPKL